MKTWYFGEIASECYDAKTFELVHQSCEGMKTADQEEFQGWYDMTKNEVSDQFGLLEDNDAFDILVSFEEQDPKDPSKEKCIWKWVSKKEEKFFIIELEKWTSERYDFY